MDLGDFRTIVGIGDTGGVAPGARRLGLPKSIVSRHLARMEEVLCVQLFSRTKCGSTRTEDGAMFRDYELRIHAEVDASQKTLVTEAALRGMLRVAAPLSFGTANLVRVLAGSAVLQHRLRIGTSFSDRVVDLVGEGFDCAIGLGRLPDSRSIARLIWASRDGIVASPAYLMEFGAPNTIEDLDQHPAANKKDETRPQLHGGKIVAVRTPPHFFCRQQRSAAGVSSGWHWGRRIANSSDRVPSRSRLARAGLAQATAAEGRHLSRASTCRVPSPKGAYVYRHAHRALWRGRSLTRPCSLEGQSAEQSPEL